MDGHTTRVELERFAQNFFCLDVAAIGQVNIGLCHWIYIVRSVKLTGGVDH